MILKKLFFSACCLLFLLTASLGAAFAEDRNFLWEATHDGGKAYVMGSIHMLKPEHYPLDPDILAAYEESEVLAVEINLKEIPPEKLFMMFMKSGNYTKGETLYDNVSEKTRRKAEEIDVDLRSYGAFRPWFAAIWLQLDRFTQMGLQEKLGVDKYFMDLAARDGKPIKQLETAEFQLNLFNGMSEEHQEMFLYLTLVELENIETEFSDLIKAWLSGDAEGFEKVFFRGFDEYPELAPVADRIIFDRNKDMTEKVLEYLSTDQTHFVIVGAGHLVGPKGILERLKEKGVRIEQR